MADSAKDALSTVIFVALKEHAIGVGKILPYQLLLISVLAFMKLSLTFVMILITLQWSIVLQPLINQLALSVLPAKLHYIGLLLTTSVSAGLSFNKTLSPQFANKPAETDLFTNMNAMMAIRLMGMDAIPNAKSRKTLNAFKQLILALHIVGA